MQIKRPTFAVKFLLFMLFFSGILLNVLVITDAELFHILIPPPGKNGGEKTPAPTPPEGPE